MSKNAYAYLTVGLVPHRAGGLGENVQSTYPLDFLISPVYSAFTRVHPSGMPLVLLSVQPVDAGVVNVPEAATPLSQ